MNDHIEAKILDPKALEILGQFPEGERSQVVEKYVIIGDTVVRYAQIVTSEESISKYFTPVTENLQSLSNNLESTRKQLEGRIPETVKAELGGLITQIKSAASSLDDMQKQYRDLFSAIIPAVSKSSTKGAISCEAVFQSLQSTFRDDRFEDVSGKARFTDILGHPSFGGQPILIEVKEYSNPVDSQEVEKFWRDMGARNSSVGCFISLRTYIRTVTNDFSIITNGSRIGVFVVSEEMKAQGHIFSYLVARKLLESLQQLTNATPDKNELILQILNNRLKEFKEGLLELEQVDSDLQKAQEGIDRIRKRVSVSRIRLETIIDVTLSDFVKKPA